MKIISRSEAKALGLKRYFTGKPCPKGHVAERQVSKCTCVECMKIWHKDNYGMLREYKKGWCEANADRLHQKAKDWYAANRQASLAKSLEWQRNNREKRREICERWKKHHPDRLAQGRQAYRAKNQIVLRKKNRKYQAQNRDKTRARTSMRRGRNRRAMPKWLSRNQKQEMLALYEQSVLCTQLFGVPYHVDHIEPIYGEDRRGLHVPWNLAILPGRENQSKGNRTL